MAGRPPAFYTGQIARSAMFWMTMLDRAMADAPAGMALTGSEIHLLDAVLTKPPDTPKTRPSYRTHIAGLRGGLAPANDPPPGDVVMWRGLSRRRDIVIGVGMAPGAGHRTAGRMHSENGQLVSTTTSNTR